MVLWVKLVGQTLIQHCVRETNPLVPRARLCGNDKYNASELFISQSLLQLSLFRVLDSLGMLSAEDAVLVGLPHVQIDVRPRDKTNNRTQCPSAALWIRFLTARKVKDELEKLHQRTGYCYRPCLSS